MDLAEQVIADIENFRTTQKCDRLVMVWCGSTEAYRETAPVHATLASLREGLARERSGDRALADLRLRRAQVPRALRQRRPNLTVDTPALLELAKKNEVPVAARTSRPARPS
jgi:myo-inositol-1-phosphate synthase